jgi:hypothetical protein
LWLKYERVIPQIAAVPGAMASFSNIDQFPTAKSKPGTLALKSALALILPLPLPLWTRKLVTVYYFSQRTIRLRAI